MPKTLVVIDKVHRANVSREKKEGAHKESQKKGKEKGKSAAPTLTPPQSVGKPLFSNVVRRETRRMRAKVAAHNHPGKKRKGRSPGEEERLAAQKTPRLVAVFVDHPGSSEVSLQSLMKKVSRKLDLRKLGTKIKNTLLAKSGRNLLENPTAKDAALVSGAVGEVIGEHARVTVPVKRILR